MRLWVVFYSSSPHFLVFIVATVHMPLNGFFLIQKMRKINSIFLKQVHWNFARYILFVLLIAVRYNKRNLLPLYSTKTMTTTTLQPVVPKHLNFSFISLRNFIISHFEDIIYDRNPIKKSLLWHNRNAEISWSIKFVTPLKKSSHFCKSKAWHELKKFTLWTYIIHHFLKVIQDSV